MKVFARIVVVVLDGVGVGETPDADRYHDQGSNSLGNTAQAVGGIRLPVMAELGLEQVLPVAGVKKPRSIKGCYGKMRPASPGKDSTSGHWELMGCILDRPFPTYPRGFPPDLVARFEKAVGREVLGNRPASGTKIIDELGEEHMRTGKPILYTSQDSVFQIAAHEEVIPLEELYRMCQVARDLLVEPHNLSRVIARPFLGRPGAFYRTKRRRDFSLPPSKKTVLDALVEAGREVVAIGKIEDLFAGRGISRSLKTEDNRDGMAKTMEVVRSGRGDLVFTNLIDFDTMWGHRNDPRAYAIGLEEFDFFAGELLEAVGEGDLLVITSDHGCDPTTASTDHSREHVPLLVFNRTLAGGRSLGLRETLSDVGATVAENFSLPDRFPGRSFLAEVGGGG